MVKSCFAFPCFTMRGEKCRVREGGRQAGPPVRLRVARVRHHGDEMIFACCVAHVIAEYFEPSCTRASWLAIHMRSSVCVFLCWGSLALAAPLNVVITWLTWWRFSRRLAKRSTQGSGEGLCMVCDQSSNPWSKSHAWC